MPRLPIDFSRTQMYRIVCKDTSITDIYVGHTTKWRERKCKHQSVCNNENDKHYNIKIYQTIRANGGWINWDMILIEDYPCTNSLEARKRERELMEEYDAKMNEKRPFATKEDRNADWREKYKSDPVFKAKILQQSIQYDADHPERKEYKKLQKREQRKEKKNGMHTELI